jgi:hypothetical protein
MKIISKHKEYYDYLVGMYGIDEMMVYDRRSEFPMEKPDQYPTLGEIRSYMFAICGNIYTLYSYKGNFYHTPEDLIELDIQLDNDGKKTINHLHKTYSGRYFSDNPVLHRAKNAYNSNNKRPTNVNSQLRIPVLVSVGLLAGDSNSYSYTSGSNERMTGRKTYWRVPMLTDFKFHKVIPAEEIYKEIYTFISWLKDHPEIPNNQTDKEKILTHGFDLKDSFRNNRK